MYGCFFHSILAAKGGVHKLRLQEEGVRWSKKLTFCKLLYHKKCKQRGVLQGPKQKSLCVYFRQSLSLRFYQSQETNFAGNKRTGTSIWDPRVGGQKKTNLVNVVCEPPNLITNNRRILLFLTFASKTAARPKTFLKPFSLGCANKDLWGLGTPISIIVVYCRTATSYFLGDKE